MTRSPNPSGTIPAALADARRALDTLLADAPTLAGIERAAGLLAAALKAGHKLLICGNGGSACDAAHFAEELTGRFRKDRPPLAAIACSDAGHITCTANDYGFEHVFSRWVEALGRKDDVLILLSTSGNSENLIRAALAARTHGLESVGLLGRDGGKLRESCTRSIIVPGDTSDRIQELHMLILHAWVEAIEHTLFPAR
ncbi:MAG: SIS domain-containing protein [Phycisphaerales bacterium]